MLVVPLVTPDVVAGIVVEVAGVLVLIGLLAPVFEAVLVPVFLVVVGAATSCAVSIRRSESISPGGFAQAHSNVTHRAVMVAVAYKRMDV
ncbi:hypothetical protein CFREI_04435 [Corynebacterium freiburgense]|nr:hypothetical protein CFREI_04435 [Corynebacterium freiburgense]